MSVIPTSAVASANESVYQALVLVETQHSMGLWQVSLLPSPQSPLPSPPTCYNIVPGSSHFSACRGQALGTRLELTVRLTLYSFFLKTFQLLLIKKQWFDTSDTSSRTKKYTFGRYNCLVKRNFQVHVAVSKCEVWYSLARSNFPWKNIKTAHFEAKRKLYKLSGQERVNPTCFSINLVIDL